MSDVSGREFVDHGQPPMELTHTTNGRLVGLGLWERICCPMTALGALEFEFGNGVGLHVSRNGLLSHSWRQRITAYWLVREGYARERYRLTK